MSIENPCKKAPNNASHLLKESLEWVLTNFPNISGILLWFCKWPWGYHFWINHTSLPWCFGPRRIAGDLDQLEHGLRHFAGGFWLEDDAASSWGPFGNLFRGKLAVGGCLRLKFFTSNPPDFFWPDLKGNTFFQLHHFFGIIGNISGVCVRSNVKKCVSWYDVFFLLFVNFFRVQLTFLFFNDFEVANVLPFTGDTQWTSQFLGPGSNDSDTNLRAIFCGKKTPPTCRRNVQVQLLTWCFVMMPTNQHLGKARGVFLPSGNNHRYRKWFSIPKKKGTAVPQNTHRRKLIPPIGQSVNPSKKEVTWLVSKMILQIFVHCLSL